MNKNNIIITLKKELRSLFRDKKATIMMFFFPFLILFFTLIFGYMDSNITDEDKRDRIGINYETNDIEQSFINNCQLDTLYMDNLDDLKELYNNGQIDGYIDFNKIQNKYTIYSDASTTSSTIYNAENYLNMYNKFLEDQKIIKEGINPDLIYNNFDVEIKTPKGKNFSSHEIVLASSLNLSFTYIIMAIAIACVNMSVSAIAVEKENGTLETILTLPIKVKELLTGKYFATVILGIIVSIFSYIITIVSLIIGSKLFETYKSVHFTPYSIIIGFFICILASFFISALAMLVTSSAKSYKEAQISGQIITVLTVLPMVINLLNLKLGTIKYIIPIYNYTTLFMDIYSGKINALNIILVVISSIIFSIIIVKILYRKFKSEKVLFGV